MHVDLHSHSTASDGSFTPSELAAAFAAHQIKVAALTDHDTMGGVEEFLRACEKLGIIGLGGIEFSTVFRGLEVHLLGYGLPLDDPGCADFLQSHYDYLQTRCRKILKKLARYGYEVPIEEVYKQSDGNPPMPPHILKALGARGYINDLEEAVRFFSEFLTFGSRAWVDHETPLEKPLGMLIDVGAIAIVGHPLRFPDLEFLEQILDAGAHGFELYYPEQTGKLFDDLEALARKRGCIVTGGSDYHGAFSDRVIGEVDVPMEVAVRLMEAIGMEVPATLACEEGSG